MSMIAKTIAAICLSAAVGSAAIAGNNGEIFVNEQGLRSVIVDYSDLNIGSAKGKAALDRRIDNAVRKVCGYEAGRQPLEALQNYRECADQATSTAWASIDNGSTVRVARGL